MTEPDPTLVWGAELTLAAALIAVAVAAVALVVFSALLVRAARYPMPTPIIAPLAMLSLVALLIGGLGGPTELIPLGATGLGALAAVLTSVYKTRNDDDDGGQE